MKKNDWLLIISVIVYSWMFYEQTAGINFLIFSAALIILLIARDKSVLKNGDWYLAASGSLVSGVCVLLFGTTLAVVSNVVSLTLLSALSISRRSSVILAGLYATYSYVSSIGFMIADLIRRKSGSQKPRGGRFWLRLGIGAGILVIVIVFFVLYQRSNPLFLDLTRKIKLDFISWPWIRFTFLGFLLLYGFFYHRNFPAWYRWDTGRPAGLNPDIYAIRENKIFGRPVNTGWEIYSGVILIALLNVLLLVVNTLDVYYLWITGDLPAGMSYSDYLHQGTTNLIISIALAILIILFFFRGHINFAEKNKWLKGLAFVWILQNIIVLFSTAYRNYLYISEYSLTYKRIGVYIWLVLTLIGLVTTFIKINGKKSNWYLFRANGWAFYIFLVLFSCQNWDQVIARFNIQQSKKLDKYYLLELSSPTVIPELLTISQNTPDLPGLPADEYSDEFYYEESDRDYEYRVNRYGRDYHDFTSGLHKRLYRFLLEQQDADWQSWNLGDQKTADRLKQLCEEGRFSKLVLKDMGLDSVDVIEALRHIEELDVSMNRIQNLDSLKAFNRLKSLNLGYNNLTEIRTLPQFKGLQQLWLNNNNIRDFSSLKKQKSLTYLNLSDNTPAVDLKMLVELHSLRELDLGNTSVEDFSALKELKSLKSLSLKSAESKDFSTLPELPGLEEIDLSDNNLGYSNSEMLEKFKKFTNLKKVDLSGNQIRTLYALTTYYGERRGFWGFSDRSEPVEPLFGKLEALNVSQNSITDINALFYYRGLKSFDVSGNNIEDFTPLNQLSHLEILNLSNTQISTLDSLGKLTQLKELNISDNPLTDVSVLKNMKGLEKLIAANCRVRDFSALKDLQKLRVLDISNNQPGDIAFVKNLKSLEVLSIRGCSITDLSPLYELTNLKVVYFDYYVDRKVRREISERLTGVRIIYGNSPYSRAW